MRREEGRAASRSVTFQRHDQATKCYYLQGIVRRPPKMIKSLVSSRESLSELISTYR